MWDDCIGTRHERSGWDPSGHLPGERIKQAWRLDARKDLRKILRTEEEPETTEEEDK